MKKSENIFISLQILKDMESKKLLLGIHFDKNARNFLIENDTIVWYPTCDEIDFIAESFELIGGIKYPEKIIEKTQSTLTSSEETTNDDLKHSSEMGIAPVENDIAIEVTAELGSPHSRKKENDEKILFQADEKKIDEILNRKKQVAKENYITKSGEKIFIDTMVKQKKKKQ